MEKNPHKNKIKSTAKTCAFTAVFVAMAIAGQFVLSVIPGVEIVTVLFCAYSFSFGVKNGMLGGTVFSLVRQLLFGFFPSVLILYLLYYNFLSLVFGLLGKKLRCNGKTFVVILFAACVCTAIFTLLDCVITPLWFAYSLKAAKGYFIASLPVMGAQVICAALTVGALFLPLERIFRLIVKRF